MIKSMGPEAATVGKGVIIELIRRKDVYVLGMLIAVFCIGALSVRMAGIEESATGTFLLNLGMTLSYLFAHLLILMLVVRQVPSEIENRTIYPILARPVTRSQFLFGKWGACALAGVLAYGVFFLMVWFAAPKLEAYHGLLLTQTLVLQVASLGLAAALGILFSLIMPKGMALLWLGVLVFLGSFLTEFCQSVALNTTLESVVNWAVLYLPDFAKLNLTTRYTDGMEAVSFGVFTGLLLHGIFFGWIAMMLSCRIFRGRVI